MEWIRFKDEKYLLVGNVEEGGAIATQQDYENGDVSFAHLGPDGTIRRFHKAIGTVNEIEFLGKVDEGKFNISPNARGKVLAGICNLLDRAVI